MGLSEFSSSIILVSIFSFLLPSTISAHNITKILDRNSEFSTFNELLTRTQLDRQINNRKTITVLAIPNDKIGYVSGQPIDVAKTILMSHVVLDYYDMFKLQKMKAKSTIVTTLYQTTGEANSQQGFLNVTQDKKTGEVVFGSAVKGSQHNVHYLGPVSSLPFNISVLSVSGAIQTPGIGDQTLRPVASPPKSNAPVASPPAETPEAEAPEAEAPEAETPADAPAADSPAPSSESEAPEADASASSPSPAADDAVDDADSSKSSSVKHLASSSFAFLLVLASFLFVH